MKNMKIVINNLKDTVNSIKTVYGMKKDIDAGIREMSDTRRSLKQHAKRIVQKVKYALVTMLSYIDAQKVYEVMLYAMGVLMGSYMAYGIMKTKQL